MNAWALIFNGSIGRCRLIIERNEQRRCRLSLIHGGTQVTVHSDGDSADELARTLVEHKLVSAKEAIRISRQLLVRPVSSVESNIVQDQ